MHKHFLAAMGFMNKMNQEKLERAKQTHPMSSQPNAEYAAREVLRFLLTYSALEGEVSTHPPELITPEVHKLIRGVETGTWGVMWEEGPHDWAVRLSLGGSLTDDDDVHLKCDTTRQGCYAEPYYGFDLFWYPESDNPLEAK
jgi:hypothetical protein